MSNLVGPYMLSLNGAELAPASAGVYLLTSGSNNAVFYVGQATDIKSRLKYHLSSAETNKCVKDTIDKERCSFFYETIGTEFMRTQTERAYYDRYHHGCNQVRP